MPLRPLNIGLSLAWRKAANRMPGDQLRSKWVCHERRSKRRMDKWKKIPLVTDSQKKLHGIIADLESGKYSNKSPIARGGAYCVGPITDHTACLNPAKLGIWCLLALKFLENGVESLHEPCDTLLTWHELFDSICFFFNLHVIWHTHHYVMHGWV